MNIKYEGKGHCWSQLIKLCLQKNTLIIPENVIGDTDQQMQFKKNLMMHMESVLTRGPVRAGNSNWSEFVCMKLLFDNKRHNFPAVFIVEISYWQ